MAWSQVTLVLLAETHLEHGRSFIGLRTDGRGWMRLLGSQPDLTVADSVIWYTPFRSARHFDVARVNIDDQPVAGRAKEDRLWRDEQLSFVQPAGRHDRGHLLAVCNSAPRLLELQGGRIEPDVAHALSSSIELIPTRPTILTRRTRTIRRTCGVEFGLSMTGTSGRYQSVTGRCESDCSTRGPASIRWRTWDSLASQCRDGGGECRGAFCRPFLLARGRRHSAYARRRSQAGLLSLCQRQRRSRPRALLTGP